MLVKRIPAGGRDIQRQRSQQMKCKLWNRMLVKRSVYAPSALVVILSDCFGNTDAMQSFTRGQAVILKQHRLPDAGFAYRPVD